MKPNPQTNLAPHERHRNACKQGQRTATVLLPGDDVAEFRRMRQELYDLFRPRTDNEARCVEAMAHHEWTKERCRSMRTAYHDKLRGLREGTSEPHCERDPHRWHHSAMDCSLEEGRLNRLMAGEYRWLKELQKRRRQNRLADRTVREAEDPVLDPPAVEIAGAEEPEPAAVGAEIPPPPDDDASPSALSPDPAPADDAMEAPARPRAKYPERGALPAHAPAAGDAAHVAWPPAPSPVTGDPPAAGAQPAAQPMWP